MKVAVLLALIVFSLSCALALKGDKCDCIITMDLHPVCGSNGLTYDNLSELKCANKCEGPVDLQHTGACRPPYAKGHAKGY